MNVENGPEIFAKVHFPECGVQTHCLIKHVKDDIYRICDHPTFAEDQVLYGDCAKMLKVDDQEYESQQVVSKSDLKFAQYIVNDKVIPEITALLDKLAHSNGYWQRDFGGLLTLYFDAEVFDPISDLEVIIGNTKELAQ